MSQIKIRFDDALLIGRGVVTVEEGRLFADGEFAVERGNVLYFTLQEGRVQHSGNVIQVMEPGDYVICRGGLFRRVLP